MAHGGLYLLAGYIAYEVQQQMNGSPGISLDPSQVNTWEWLVPLLIAAPIIMVIGLLVQQVLLRWNQGQELRQALITIAVVGDRRRPDHRPLPADGLEPERSASAATPST